MIIYFLNPVQIMYNPSVSILEKSHPDRVNKTNGYFEKVNGNKYLTVVPTNESREIMKKKSETVD